MGYNGADIVFPHLGIVIQKIENHITLFGFDIMFYGLIIGLAFLLAMFLAAGLAKKKGMDTDLYWDFYIFVVIAGVVGSRLYYVLFNLEYYLQNPAKIFNIREGGLAIYGGVIAVILVMIVFCRVKKLKFTAFVDNIVPGLLLGQAMGRWGNFFNCECFGGYTDSLMAMRIRKDLVSSSMMNEEVLSHLVTDGGVQYIQVHPTFLYESLWNTATLIFVLWFKKKKQKADGEILWLYMICYGIGRFVIEGMRTDSLMIGNTGLRVSQCVALVSAIAGVILFVLGRRNLKKAEEGTEKKSQQA